MVSRDWAEQHIHECIVGSPCGFCPALNLGLRTISLSSGSSDDYRTHYSQTSKVTTTQRLRHTCDKICPSYQLVISIGNVLGRHLWNPLAAAIYGLNLMTVNALGTLLWFYASSRPGLVSEGVSPRAIRFIGEAGILWFGLVVFSAENQAFSSEN
jgi:hypothetical protein